MASVDLSYEEPIRRWPVWFARLANLIIGWTDSYCSGGCGYPINGTFTVTIDEVEGLPVNMLVCSLHGDCEQQVTTHPTDQDGTRYSEVRPHLVAAAKEMKEQADPGSAIRIAFTR